jgi:hypothetical protein
MPGATMEMLSHWDLLVGDYEIQTITRKEDLAIPLEW